MKNFIIVWYPLLPEKLDVEMEKTGNWSRYFFLKKACAAAKDLKVFSETKPELT